MYLATLYFLAVVRENEIARGPRWPSTLGMDPHEVAGGLHNNGCWSLHRHTPEPLAREANLAGTLHGGPGKDIGLSRQAKWVKELQRPQ